MNIESLRDFVEFCKYMNFTKAAKQLNITQPALSYHIASLEKELGVQLVDRSRSVRLTPVGTMFFSGAQILVMQYDELKEACRNHPGQNKDKKRIIVKTPVLVVGHANLIFRTLLTQFSEIHPDIDIVLTAEHSSNFIDEMLAGNLDCVLTYAFNGTPSIIEEYYEQGYREEMSGIEYIPIATIPLSVCVAETSKLATKESLSLKDINGYMLLYDYEVKSTEVLYAFVSHCLSHDIKPILKPALLHFSEISVLSLEANEMILSSPTYPIPERLINKLFVEKPAHVLHVALKDSGENEAVSLLRDFLLSRTPEDFT